MKNLNQIVLNGVISTTYSLRYTPSGISIQSFLLNHLSNQIDGGVERIVKCRILCILLNLKLFDNNFLLNKNVIVKGFISINSKEQIVLNVQDINFITNC